MISYEEMPDDNADLGRIQVEFPRLEPDTPESSPQSIESIIEYLRMESPDGEDVDPGHLQFLRTARVGEHRYWIWRFRESDGAECFVTVSVSAHGEICTGYDENYYSLTPEQFILGDYHGVF